MRRPGPLVATLAVAALAAAPAIAASYVGDRASGCVSVGAGNTHVLTLNAATSPGETLLVIGMTSGGAAAAATPVVDTRANSWLLAASYTAVNGERLFVYETTVAAGKAHTAGDTVTLSYTGATGQQSCATLSDFGGLQTASSVDRTSGTSGSGTAPAGSTGAPTTQASEMLVVAFGFLASTGGFTYQGALQPMSGSCNAPVCLFPGYQKLSTTGTYTPSATTGNVTNWGALVVTLKGRNPVFADGFELGIGAWSARRP